RTQFHFKLGASMQPSSATSGPDRGSNLRRWGPIAAIVVVIAIVVTVVLIAGKSDDKKPAATSSGSSSSGAAGTATLPEGAIPFSQKGSRTDLTFPSTCDQSTGKIAMPFFYAPECFANVKDNGGATAKGVTADTIP